MSRKTIICKGVTMSNDRIAIAKQKVLSKTGLTRANGACTSNCRVVRAGNDELPGEKCFAVSSVAIISSPG